MFTRMYSIGFRVENVWPAIWSRFYSSRNIGRNAADRSAKQNEMISAEEHILFIFPDVQRNKGNEGVEDRWNNVEFVRFRLFSKNF